jgi:tetratricopeptide (TPR) repeat protein
VPDDESSINNSRLLRIADSVRSFNPDAADSIYRIVVDDNSFNNKNSYALALLGRATLKISQNALDTALMFIERTGEIARELNDTLLLMKYYNSRGDLFNKKENFEETEKCFSTGLHLAELAGNEPIRHTFLLNLGQVFIDKGNYAEAMKTFTTELKHSEGTGNEDYQAIALQNMANIAFLTDDHSEAIRLTQKSLAIQKKLNLMQDYADQLQNLGIFYKNFGIFDSAVMYYRQALDILSKSGDSVKMIRVRYNMGNLLKNQQKFAEAEKEMKEIIRFCKKNEIFSGYAMALSSLATIYAKTNRIEQGIAAIDSSILLVKKNNLINLFVPIYNIKQSLMADIGRYDIAYQVLTMQQQITDSLLSIDKQKEILALKTRYETEKKETENTLLKKDNEIQKSQLWVFRIIIILGFLLLVFIIIGFYLWRKKIKQAEQLSLERSNVLKLESRQKIIELEKVALENKVKEEALTKLNLENQLKEEVIEKMELQSGLKEQELIYQSLAKAELIQILNSMREKLLPFQMKLQRKKDQDDFVQMLGNIIHERNKDPLSEFEMLFKNLHPKFYEKLLALNPTLSKSEIQICAMIRLNLSTKDIARLINLNVSSIDTTRYHIRQKLKLDPKDNLTVHLMTI